MLDLKHNHGLKYKYNNVIIELIDRFNNNVTSILKICKKYNWLLSVGGFKPVDLKIQSSFINSTIL